jgi:hypothetical protein
VQFSVFVALVMICFLFRAGYERLCTTHASNLCTTHASNLCTTHASNLCTTHASNLPSSKHRLSCRYSSVLAFR